MSLDVSETLQSNSGKIRITSTMRRDWQVFAGNQLLKSFSPSSTQCEEPYSSGYPSLHIIAMTEACNQSCSYCQASAKDHKEEQDSSDTYHEQLDYFDKIITFILTNSSRRITVEFQGGEPLLKFNTICYVVDKFNTLSKDYNKVVRFRLVSNLTTLNDKIAFYLAQNRFTVSTSLDGLPDLHDENRKLRTNKGSYSKVIAAINLLFNYRISPSVMIVISRKSLQFPNEIIDNLVQIGLHQIFLKPVYPIGYAKQRWAQLGVDSNAYQHFWKRAVSRCLAYNMAEYPITDVMFSIILQKVLWGQDPHFVDLSSPCGAAYGQIAYDLNGNIYTCDEGRFGNRLMVGNVNWSGFEDVSSHPLTLMLREASKVHGKYCGKCAYQPWCGRCPMMAHHEHGNVELLSERYFFCRVTKSLFNAFFELVAECPEQLEVASRIISMTNLFKTL